MPAHRGPGAAWSSAAPAPSSLQPSFSLSPLAPRLPCSDALFRCRVEELPPLGGEDPAGLLLGEQSSLLQLLHRLAYRRAACRSMHGRAHPAALLAAVVPPQPVYPDRVVDVSLPEYGGAPHVPEVLVLRGPLGVRAGLDEPDESGLLDLHLLELLGCLCYQLVRFHIVCCNHICTSFVLCDFVCKCNSADGK